MRIGYFVAVLTLLFACTGGAPTPTDSTPLGNDSGNADSGLPSDTDDTGRDTADSADTAGTACGELPADDAGYAELFAVDRVHTLTLTLSADEAASLAARPDKWAEAAAELDGHPFSSVGVQWRGDGDQMRWDGKPSWVLGFREQKGCDTMAGLERVQLEAMLDDPAQVRTVLEGQVLEGLGRTVPHAVFATVEVGGESLGLYALTEPIDAAFAVHRFGADPVSVWSSNNGADFTTAGLKEWDAETDGADDAALAAVAAVVASPASTFYADLGALVDEDDLVDHWASLAAVGDIGTWPYETDDVGLALVPGGKLKFIADRPGSGWAIDYAWSQVDSALAVRCVYDSACSAAVKAALAATSTKLARLDTASMLDDDIALTAEAVAADTRRGTRSSEVASARTALTTTLAGWPAAMLP